MKKELFEELCQSIKQAGAVGHGKRVATMAKGARKRGIASTNLVALSRSKLHLSQLKFALLLGVSVKSVQNWEQGRRKPTGAAKVLLKVVVKHPHAVLNATADMK